MSAVKSASKNKKADSKAAAGSKAVSKKLENAKKFLPARPVYSNKYELMLLLNPLLEADQLDSVLRDVEAQITQQEGTILKSDRVGRKKMAYPIQQSKEALFVYIAFEGYPNKLTPLTNMMRINEHILRSVVTRVHTNRLDAGKEILTPMINTVLTTRDPRTEGGPRGPRRGPGGPGGGRFDRDRNFGGPGGDRGERGGERSGDRHQPVAHQAADDLALDGDDE